MHKATPHIVLEGGEEQYRHTQKRAEFIKIKKELRKEIMANVRVSSTKHKSKIFIGKATKALTKIRFTRFGVYCEVTSVLSLSDGDWRGINKIKIMK
ncbi:MAG: hypothetical protein HRT88_05125 [Lentisphaeraceae bacterium]|nr:hypothetical protein [Lentisphaeraceae bacterium]